MNTAKWSASLALIGATLFSGAAVSALVTPNFSMSVDASAMSMPMMFDETDSTVMSTNDPAHPDEFTAMGTHISAGVWRYDWNLTMDPDPYIGGSFSIRNMSSMTQTFALNFMLPVSITLGSAYKSGTLGASLTDTGGDGSAQLSNISWNGMIDGAPAMNLLSGGGLCFGSAGGCSASVFPVTDGPLFHAAGVNSSIGIQMSFDLTAGDTADFTTQFEVAPVPVPAAIWLLGSGLLGLIGVARRRRV